MARGYRNLQVSFAGGEMSPEMYSRVDDARARSGAARLLNMITHPRGSAARRPGFEFVREVKDSNFKVRLLPFRFSVDDTYAVEMGRAIVDLREIGYFRFHTLGGTLLQQLPEDFVPTVTPTAVDFSVPSVTTQNWAVPQDVFKTGDPIVFTMQPTASSPTCTFDIGNDWVVSTAHGFNNNDTVMFSVTGGTLPAGLRQNRTYYVRDATVNNFRISDVRNGPLFDFNDAGSGTQRVACLPHPDEKFVEINQRFWAIRVDATNIRIAATKTQAEQGISLSWFGDGTVPEGDVRIHYDYRQGDVAFDKSLGSPFYMFRDTTWGPVNSRFCFLENHLGHPTTNLEYWVRQPGSQSEVTFDDGTLTVTWLLGAHGLSDGDPITFTTDGSLPTGLTPGQVYYLTNAMGATFQLSDTPLSGTVVPFTGAGTGTHDGFANGIYEVPHFYAEDILFEINHVQSGDILSLTHIDRPAAELSRLGPQRWCLEDIKWNADVDAPVDVFAVGFVGEGDRPISVTPKAAPLHVELNFASEVTFSPGERVTAENIEDTSGTPSYVPDGTYIVESAVNSGGVGIVTLKEEEDGAPVVFSPAFGNMSGLARLRATGAFVDTTETYVVTALDENSEESDASDPYTIDNNLLVRGAYNTINWAAVTGATRYRVYKDVNGLFGFIGETDAPGTSFVDDNIEPDLSITPPILDERLRVTESVTFDLNEDTVIWENHGLEEGSPVLFQPEGTLPTNLEFEQTYYVLNPSEDDFQLTETPDGTQEVNLSGSPTGRTGARAGFFPGAVCYFEQRRVVGGARLRPQDFWLTASGTESDLTYSIPTRDADRIQNRLAARERSAIRHAVPAGDLLLLTSAAEYRVTPLNAVTLTPSTISVRAPTQVGASGVAPVVVNNAVLFPADRGGHLRELGFSDAVRDYVTGDVSIRASHLFENKTLVQLTYHRAPNPIVWAVSSGGTLLGLSYTPEEAVAGWHEHSIDGTIESVVAVAEGIEDRLYIVANRNGTRYIERLGEQWIDDFDDVFFVDQGVTYKGAPITEIFVRHLANTAVVYLADGVKGTGTVDANGKLTLTTAASTIHVGLSYKSKLTSLPLWMQIDAAFGSGSTKNVTKAFIRVRYSGEYQFGPAGGLLSDSETVAAGQLETKLTEITGGGKWDLEGQIDVEADDPLPLIVTGLTLEVASGG